MTGYTITNIFFLLINWLILYIFIYVSIHVSETLSLCVINLSKSRSLKYESAEYCWVSRILTSSPCLCPRWGHLCLEEEIPFLHRHYGWLVTKQCHQTACHKRFERWEWEIITVNVWSKRMGEIYRIEWHHIKCSIRLHYTI